FIPLWYLGNEWNNPSAFEVDYYWKRDKLAIPKSWSLFGNRIDWEARKKNAAFLEDVKKYIAIRRTHPEIFEFFPDDHRESNICKVRTDRPDLLQPYARYRDGKAVLVVPNNSAALQKFTIKIPHRECGIAQSAPCTVTDLMSGKKIASGKVDRFAAEIPANGLGVFLVDGQKSAEGPAAKDAPLPLKTIPQQPSAIPASEFRTVLYRNLGDSPEALKRWEGARAENFLPAGGPDGKYAIRLVSSSDQGNIIHFLIPAGAVRGKVLRLSAMVQAQNVKSKSLGYMGVKFMIYAVGADKKSYNQETMTRADRFGSYPWRELATVFHAPKDLMYLRISIGVYGTEGTALFSGINLAAK
ncbi:MAG: hypothetical protein PHS41_13275, partial [Victivallaceae bacterium]|nr:hypothetical protein [Victivallaceae bacterium]